MVMRWWRKRQRDIDLRILWPACREQAVSLGEARFAFLVHMESDPAWTKDFTGDELVEFVNGLD